MSYFSVKLKYEKVQSNGAVKPVSDIYLFDALSFTEAEALAIDKLTPLLPAEYTIEDVSRKRIAEVFKDGHGDRWYLATLHYITIDEVTAVEKKKKSRVLVQASDFDTAYRNLKCGMKDTIADYEVFAILETAIIDVFLHD